MERVKPAYGAESVVVSKEAPGIGGVGAGRAQQKAKPPFRPAKDDTKPLLRDPILRSDPMETEQAVLRPPPFP